MFYSATRVIVDTINNVRIQKGDVVQTSCSKWVKRLGSGLERISAPEDPELLEQVIVIEKTVEDGDLSSQEKEVEVPSEESFEDEKPKPRVQRKVIPRSKAK